MAVSTNDCRRFGGSGGDDSPFRATDSCDPKAGVAVHPVGTARSPDRPIRSASAQLRPGRRGPRIRSFYSLQPPRTNRNLPGVERPPQQSVNELRRIRVKGTDITGQIEAVARDTSRLYITTRYCMIYCREDNSLLVLEYIFSNVSPVERALSEKGSVHSEPIQG